MGKNQLQRCLLETEAQEWRFLLFPTLKKDSGRKRKATPVSSRKNKKLMTQVIDYHPGSYGVCDATVIATPMKAD